MAYPVHQTTTSYVVARPHATDAIGCVLRDAFEDERLPDDWLELLGDLDEDDRLRPSN